MLSNKERKYRSKIIAENHLKKDGQKYLDQYAKSELLTYKKIYLNHSLLRSMSYGYNISKLSNAMKSIGVSCSQASDSLQELIKAFKT